MKDFLKKFQTASNYNTWKSTENYIEPHVGLIEATNELTYKQFIPFHANKLDILWSDLTVTSEIRPTTDGVIPIGLCVIATDELGSGEKARFISLKFMDNSSPENGSTGRSLIYWGYNSDIQTLTNIGDVNNARNDLDGKSNTEKILALATTQSTWKTDSSISNKNTEGYYPAACCCARYHTIGTNAGDWYLPSYGELYKVKNQQSDIQTKLNSINSNYSSYCIHGYIASQRTPSLFYETQLLSSTEYADSETIWGIQNRSGYYTNYFSKDTSNDVIAMLQF